MLLHRKHARRCVSDNEGGIKGIHFSTGKIQEGGKVQSLSLSLFLSEQVHTPTGGCVQGSSYTQEDATKTYQGGATGNDVTQFVNRGIWDCNTCEPQSIQRGVFSQCLDELVQLLFSQRPICHLKVVR